MEVDPEATDCMCICDRGCGEYNIELEDSSGGCERLILVFGECKSKRGTQGGANTLYGSCDPSVAYPKQLSSNGSIGSGTVFTALSKPNFQVRRLFFSRFEQRKRRSKPIAKNSRGTQDHYPASFIPEWGFKKSTKEIATWRRSQLKALPELEDLLGGVNPNANVEEDCLWMNGNGSTWTHLHRSSETFERNKPTLPLLHSAILFFTEWLHKMRRRNTHVAFIRTRAPHQTSGIWCLNDRTVF
ncbi:hypothetical protein BDN70DRAFT_902404 [Pholiota conissans]|uniref:Uncharacterized protein n=1 Tax=Pholiota conissans TaxID=109636 RepID=A0A9P6CKK3_9AGAR|nr:hypothetical protein BDN70DRAFT_902404 [Pholiota conissans]